MSSQSPASVLYDSNGVAIAVYNNTSLVASQPAVLFAGSDGYNTQFSRMTSYGALFGTQASNNTVVFNNATITASGSMLIENSYFGMQQINLIVNVSSAPTGTNPTLQFTIEEIDPGDQFTVFGTPVSTSVISNTGVFTAVLTNTHSSSIKITWTIGGTGGPTFTGVYATVTTKSTPDAQAITGSITANNASVSPTGSAPPADATYIGGSVTTAAPTYTNGTMNALSLTTSGLLRIDGVYPLATAVASAPDMGQVGGVVTTAAPTYTTGTVNALSLDTAGNLRTTVTNTVAVSGTVAVTQSTSPWIVAGGGTAGTPATGVVTVQGISGMTPLSVQTNKAATSAVTSVAQATSNTVILSSNPNRVFASIYNNSGQKMFIKLGTTASNSSYSIQLMPNSYWEVPNDWTGEIDALWSGSGSGAALVTELTP